MRLKAGRRGYIDTFFPSDLGSSCASCARWSGGRGFTARGVMRGVEFSAMIYCLNKVGKVAPTRDARMLSLYTTPTHTNLPKPRTVLHDNLFPTQPRPDNTRIDHVKPTLPLKRPYHPLELFLLDTTGPSKERPIVIAWRCVSGLAEVIDRVSARVGF